MIQRTSTTAFFTRLAPAFIAAAGLVLPISASALQDPQQEPRQERADRDERARADETRQLKVFELEHRDPEQMKQIIALVIEDYRVPTDATLPTAVRPDADPDTEPTAAPVRPDPMDTRSIMTASSPDDRLLFVRGPENKLEKVAGVVEAFDVPREELRRYSRDGVHLIPIPGDRAPRVERALAQLNLEAEIVTLEDISVAVLRDDVQDEREIEQAERVISRIAGIERNNQQ